MRRKEEKQRKQVRMENNRIVIYSQLREDKIIMQTAPQNKKFSREQPSSETVDYRNCKYLGQVKQHSMNRLPHGFGMLLDQNYTWLACMWSNGAVANQGAVAVFGDSDKMYWIGRGQADGHGVVYEGNGFRVWKCARTIVFDMLDFVWGRSHYHNTLMKFEIWTSPNGSNSLKLIDKKVYNGSNKQEALSLILSDTPIFEVDFQQFIRGYLPKYVIISPHLHTQTHTSTSTSSTKSRKTQLTIQHNYLQRSMGISMAVGQRCKLLCMQYQHHDQVLEKVITYYQQGGCLVQENISGQAEVTVEYELPPRERDWVGVGVCCEDESIYGRPNPEVQKQCTKILLQYYKRSLYFQNHFLDLSVIYKLRQQFQTLLQLCLKELEDEKMKNNEKRVPITQYSKFQYANDQEFIREGYVLSPFYNASADDIKKQLQRTEELARSKTKAAKLEKPYIYSNWSQQSPKKKAKEQGNQAYNRSERTPERVSSNFQTGEENNKQDKKTSRKVQINRANDQPKDKDRQNEIYNETTNRPQYQYFFESKGSIRKNFQHSRMSNANENEFFNSQGSPEEEKSPMWMKHLDANQFQSSNQDPIFESRQSSDSLFNPEPHFAYLENQGQQNSANTNGYNGYKLPLETLTVNYQDIEDELMEIEEENRQKIKGTNRQLLSNKSQRSIRPEVHKTLVFDESELSKKKQKPKQSKSPRSTSQKKPIQTNRKNIESTQTNNPKYTIPPAQSQPQHSTKQPSKIALVYQNLHPKTKYIDK